MAGVCLLAAVRGDWDIRGCECREEDEAVDVSDVSDGDPCDRRLIWDRYVIACISFETTPELPLISPAYTVEFITKQYIYG